MQVFIKEFKFYLKNEIINYQNLIIRTKNIVNLFNEKVSFDEFNSATIEFYQNKISYYKCLINSFNGDMVIRKIDDLDKLISTVLNYKKIDNNILISLIGMVESFNKTLIGSYFDRFGNVIKCDDYFKKYFKDKYNIDYVNKISPKINNLNKPYNSNKKQKHYQAILNTIYRDEKLIKVIDIEELSIILNNALVNQDLKEKIIKLMLLKREEQDMLDNKFKFISEINANNLLIYKTALYNYNKIINKEYINSYKYILEEIDEYCNLYMQETNENYKSFIIRELDNLIYQLKSINESLKEAPFIKMRRKKKD